MTIPGQTIGVSVVLDPIIGDLGLDRTLVSAIYTVGTLAGSLSLPFVGRAIDRHGPRRSVVAIAIAFALACGFMGLVNGLITLAIGFTLIRGLGQGALGLVSVHSINIWFVRRRGMAVGLAGVGMATATAVVPIGIAALVDAVDWRAAYLLMGLTVLLLMAPVGGIFFRHRPERYGLRPDGPRAPDEDGDEPSITEVDYSPAEARRTLTFWLYVTGGFLTAALGTGLVFHHFSIVGESGVARPAAATVFIAYGFVSAGANLVSGFLLDRIPPRFVLSLSLATMAAAMLAAPRVSTVTAIAVYGAALGMMQGSSQAIQSSVYAYYFGRLHIGAIKGLSTTITVAGTAFGPLLLAVGFDRPAAIPPSWHGPPWSPPPSHSSPLSCRSLATGEFSDRPLRF